ncbi:flagellin [Planctobacterium marinum]|uniref:Flagellin n=1 Tax=Planctobacterium marinum TaxID=1631968 RepID=A0AA48HIZ2_9ALTE|nr:flagellin [Planctobacterium marinum]
MGLFVNTNISSLNAQRQLFNLGNQESTSFERLSSGLIINRAADDAAGLRISERLTSQVNGLQQGIRNANDGISLVQTFEGALDETANNLQRLRQLTVQAGNGVYSDADRNALQEEAQELKREIERIAATTTFGGTSAQSLGLLGLYSRSFQVGANAGQSVDVDLTQNNSAGFGIGGLGLQGLDVSTGQSGAAIVSNELTSFMGGTTLTDAELAALDNPELTIRETRDQAEVIADVGALAPGTYNFGVSSNWGNNFTEVTVEVTGNQSADADAIIAAINAELGQDLLELSGSNRIVTGDYEVASFSTLDRDINSRILIAGRTDNPSNAVSSSIGEVGLGDIYDETGIRGNALDTIDDALERLNSARAELGATQNRFQSTLRNVTNVVENLSASRSRIMDADFAVETALLTKNQIVQQASTSILSQANQRSQLALSLLG